MNPLTDAVGYILWLSAPLAAVCYGFTQVAWASGTTAERTCFPCGGYKSGNKRRSANAVYLRALPVGNNRTRTSTSQLEYWLPSLTHTRALMPLWALVLISCAIAGGANALAIWRVWRIQATDCLVWMSAIGMHLAAGIVTFMWPSAMIQWRALRAASVLATLSAVAYTIVGALLWTLYGQDTLGRYEVWPPILYTAHVVWVVYMAAVTVRTSTLNAHLGKGNRRAVRPDDLNSAAAAATRVYM